MEATIKHYIIKIPSKIFLYYSEKRNFLIVGGPFLLSCLKLTIKLNVHYRTNILKITKIAFKSISRNKKKIFKSLQGNCHSKIKRIILDCYSKLCKKLKFVGVGYKAFLLKEFKMNILRLRLGFSHEIFIKLPMTLRLQCFRATKIYVLSNLYQEVLRITSTIRSYKKPEPYKGKGVLYLSETIDLKEGKKL